MSANAFESSSPECAVGSDGNTASQSVKSHLCRTIEGVCLFSRTLGGKGTVLIVIGLRNLDKTDFRILKKAQCLIKEIRKYNMIGIEYKNKFFIRHTQSPVDFPGFRSRSPGHIKHHSTIAFGHLPYFLLIQTIGQKIGRVRVSDKLAGFQCFFKHTERFTIGTGCKDGSTQSRFCCHKFGFADT